VRRAEAKNLDVFKLLHKHDASTVLQSTGDAILTGHTGTNVSDLKIVLIGDM